LADQVGETMLAAARYGEVLRIEMARSLFGKGWYWTTAYLVGQTLIDTGPAHTARELLHHLQDIPISQILNTHAHEDHIGGNGPLQHQRDGLKIYAHPEAIPILENPAAKQPLQLYRQLMWGWPDPCNADPINETDSIRDGHLHFEVLHTPGHTPHHLCFFEPDRGWLFSGDLFIGGHDRALGAGNDIWAIISSLKRLADLPVRILFPGAAHVRTDPEKELRARIRFLENLGDRILSLNEKGWDRARIAREVSGGPMFIELFTWGHFSRRHLVDSYLRGSIGDRDLEV
jgi:glyoxylase-like metal-dependent hydrolase (beta-lactamase superfamily II)